MSLQRGFGLIELLLVIAIIGILVGMILVGTSRARLKAYDTAIENAVRQLRWQAEIAFNSNNLSYVDWPEVTIIQEEVAILLYEIDKHYGVDPEDEEYVAVLRSTQSTEFCVSAPSRAEPDKYYCVDATGQLKSTDAHCPDHPSDGLPLRCP